MATRRGAKACALAIAVFLFLIAVPRNDQLFGEQWQEPPAPAPSITVRALLDVAEQLLQARRSVEALRAAEAAGSAARQSDDLVGHAIALSLQTRAFIQLGQLDQAIAAALATVGAWETGGHGPEQIDALVSLSRLLSRLQRPGAYDLLTEALKVGVAESVRPLAAAERLREAAAFYSSRNELVVAKGFLLAAAAVRTRVAPGSVALAEDLGSTGEVAYRLGELEAAYDFHERALAIRRQIAPQSLEVVNSTDALADLARKRGKLDRALELNDEALVLLRQLAPDSVNVAANLANRGTVKIERGDLKGAREDFQAALLLFDALAPDSLGRAACLNNFGALLKMQGDLEAAGDVLAEALALRQKHAPDSLEVASTLDNLGAIAFSAGDIAPAAAYVRRASALRERLEPDSLAMARSLANLGVVLSRQGQLSEAAEYLRRALALKERLAPDSPTIASTHHNLGELALHQSRIAEAEAHLRRALALREKLAPESLEVANSLTGLATVMARRKEWSESERLARRAWDLAREHRAGVSGDQARQAFEVQIGRHSHALIRAQLALGRPEAAFRTLEEARAHTLRQLLLERELPAGADHQLLAAYRSGVIARDQAEGLISRTSAALMEARRRLERAQLGQAPADEITLVRRSVEELTLALNQAQVAHSRARIDADQQWMDLMRAAPRLAPPLLAPSEGVRLLTRDTLYLAFVVDLDETLLFVMRGGTGRDIPLTVARIVVSESKLKEVVKAYHQLVTSRAGSMNEITASGHALFDLLFPKTVRRELNVVSRVLLSPDGPLWDLPFASLAVTAKGRPQYLGAWKALTYTPSLSLFAQGRLGAERAGEITPSALVVGDPVFSREPGRSSAATLRGVRRWLSATGRPPDRLPATLEEAKQVAKLYGAEPLLHDKATEGALRTLIDRADIVHLATHGYLHPLRAMNSGVILASPSQDPLPGETMNDGVLEAWEVIGQLQLKAQLVVLSACETARGEVVAGEGLIGLARAFQVAGARAVIASQWQIIDASTAQFMVVFHTGLRQGLPKDLALQAAVKKFLPVPGTAHPYYWAAFRLVGDPSPISTPAR
jgi:CHAT domain-containing protein/Tfp pilus assembly protein PilF